MENSRLLIIQQKYDISLSIWKYCSPVLLIFGIGGNLLSIIILCRKNMRHLHIRVQLLMLSIADLLVLFFVFLPKWFFYVQNISIWNVSAAVCKTYVWLAESFFQFSPWTLIVITLGRFASVFRPIATWSSKDSGATQAAKILAVWLVLLAINSHFLYGMGPEYSDITNATVLVRKCGLQSGPYRIFVKFVWIWLNSSLFCFVPFSLLTLCNLAIVLRLKGWCRESLLRGRVSPTSVNTKLVAVISVLFLVTNLPMVVFLISYHSLTSSTEEDLVNEFLVGSLINMILITGNALNFVLYMLSGKPFRNEFMSLFRRNNRVAHSSPLFAIHTL